MRWELVEATVAPLAMLLCGIFAGTATVRIPDGSGASFRINLPPPARAVIWALVIVVAATLAAAGVFRFIRLNLDVLLLAPLFLGLGWTLVYFLFLAAIRGRISPVKSPLLDVYPVHPALAAHA